MAFIITHDYIDTDAVGTVGPSGIADVTKSVLRAVADGHKRPETKTEHFHMYDGDGERYYSGYWLDDDKSDEFEALDCFGLPNAGCTEIRMKNRDGKYTAV